MRKSLEFLIIAILIFTINLAIEFYFSREKPVIQQPQESLPTPTPTDAPSVDNRYIHLEGLASWYGTGENECLGCNPGRIMANGEKLDDNKKTVACAIGGSCKYFDIGDRVEILNLDNMMVTTAIVTDRGGFAKYGRIIDMTKAVKNALNCNDLCRVRVTKY